VYPPHTRPSSVLNNVTVAPLLSHLEWKSTYFHPSRLARYSSVAEVQRGLNSVYRYYAYDKKRIDNESKKDNGFSMTSIRLVMVAFSSL
jgi:hypothetical protein